MKTKTLRSTVVSVLVFLALTRPLAGGTSDGVLNFGNLPLASHSPTYTSFDAPGAGTGPNQGTVSLAINPAGAITGYYIDASGVNHGFLRTTKGSITTFDPPGAAGFGTQPYSISPSQTITGAYGDTNNVIHGFLRSRSGAISTFDAPGASPETVPSDVNPAGTVAGWYYDASFVAHGFLRAPDGTFTTYDAPGAGTGTFQGTYIGTVDCLNPAGVLAGISRDANDVFHGYVRAPDGTIAVFDAPGAGTGTFQGTQPVGINPAGTIVGQYVDSSGVNHGFLRAADGTITTFDVSGAGTGSGQGSFPYCNNAVGAIGAITGYYIDSSDVFHGFLRTP